MPTGKIVRLFLDKGFGFIQPDHRTTERDVFFHSRECLQPLEMMHELAAVEYEEEPSSRGPRACAVSLID